MKKKNRKSKAFSLLSTNAGLLIVIMLSFFLIMICKSLASGQTKNSSSEVSSLPEVKAAFAATAASAASAAAQKKTIILDPGHGGEDPGATGADGVYEKDMNLSIAKKLQAQLQREDYHVVMTREKDILLCDSASASPDEQINSDLNNRVKIENRYPDAIFISIHQNYNDEQSYSGTQVYFSENTPGSKTLAQNIQSQVVKDLQPDNHREIQGPNNLRVLMKAKIPAVLIECGFITNTTEARNLQSGDYQEKFCKAIVQAVDTYLSRSSG